MPALLIFFTLPRKAQLEKFLKRMLIIFYSNNYMNSSNERLFKKYLWSLESFNHI